MNRKVIWVLVIVVVAALGLYSYQTPYQWTSKQGGNFQGGDSDPMIPPTDDQEGSIQGESTITVVDSDGNVLSAHVWAFESAVIEPCARGECDAEADAAAACNNIPGYHWDYAQGICIPNAADPTDPAEQVPEVTEFTIPGDFERFEFSLNWVEIKGYLASKTDLYIKIKGRILLANEEWSEVLDDISIKAWNDEFRFTDLDAETWLAKATTDTMIDNDLKLDKTELPNTALYLPLTAKFYYYAKSQSTLDGHDIESEGITRLMVAKTSGLSGLQGESPALLIVPAIRRILACACA